MFRRKKTLEEKITRITQEEFAKIVASLESDHQEYRLRLRLKERTKGRLEDSYAEVEKLYAERIALKKRFWGAYYEEDDASVSRIESRSRSLERAIKKAERTLKKARMNFAKSDFDEVAESFALRTKASLAEDEVNRRIEELKKAFEELLSGIRHETKETGQALRDEYKEPHFETDEEKDAHVKKTIEILKAVTESYTPGK
jgi:hypothetical protein